MFNPDINFFDTSSVEKLISQISYKLNLKGKNSSLFGPIVTIIEKIVNICNKELVNIKTYCHHGISRKVFKNNVREKLSNFVNTFSAELLNTNIKAKDNFDGIQNLFDSIRESKEILDNLKNLEKNYSAILSIKKNAETFQNLNNLPFLLNENIEKSIESIIDKIKDSTQPELRVIKFNLIHAHSKDNLFTESQKTNIKEAFSNKKISKEESLQKLYEINFFDFVNKNEYNEEEKEAIIKLGSEIFQNEEFRKSPHNYLKNWRIERAYRNCEDIVENNVYLFLCKTFPLTIEEDFFTFAITALRDIDLKSDLEKIKAMANKYVKDRLGEHKQNQLIQERILGILENPQYKNSPHIFINNLVQQRSKSSFDIIDNMAIAFFIDVLHCNKNYNYANNVW